MAWAIESVTSNEAWFREGLDLILSSTTRSLPGSTFKVGASSISWRETEPGFAFIEASGGTVEDRVLARRVAQSRLGYHGYRQAQYTLDHGALTKEASWDDIMAKAKRLIQSQQVHLLRNGANVIVGHVKGDHGEYQTEISRDDPDSRAITQWTCECPWDQYAFQRTRQWKKYEARPCAHVLATWWKSQATPLDDEVKPGGPGQMSMPGMEPNELQPGAPGQWFNPQMQTGPPIRPLKPGPMLPPAEPGSMGTQLPIPGADQTPPPPPDVMPPFPMDQIQEPVPPTVSVPGAKPPTPANPVQYPGGTFSSWRFADEAFKPGMAVQFVKPEMGTAVGKSTEHGAGGWQEIPAGAVAEFVYQDPTTGLCEVRWPLHSAGPMEPFHVECAVDPSFIRPRPDLANPFEKTWPRR